MERTIQNGMPRHAFWLKLHFMSGKNASSLWINLKPNQFISSAGHFILFYITIEIIFYQLEVWHKTSIYSWKSTFTSLLFYFLCRKYENQNQGIFILYIQERNPLFPVQVWCKIIILVNNESFIFYIMKNKINKHAK